MSEKNVISTNVKTDTKVSKNADGTTVKVITTTTTEKYSDGSTITRTKVETQREVRKTVPITPERSVSVVGINPVDCKAPRAEITTDDKFIDECLKAHNEYRAKHKAAPLVLNKELCKIAQARANHNAAQGKMQHGDSGYGENIYFNSQQIDGKKAVDGWYSEIKDYNWNKLEGQKGTGHFTQVIWKGSREVGIAKATSPPPKSYTFVVANYNPPGNFIGKYPDNISHA